MIQRLRSPERGDGGAVGVLSDCGSSQRVLSLDCQEPWTVMLRNHAQEVGLYPFFSLSSGEPVTFSSYRTSCFHFFFLFVSLFHI